MISPATCQPHLQAIEKECGLTVCGLKVTLIQKGLRLMAVDTTNIAGLLESNPDSEGIKTGREAQAYSYNRA